jgi:hypothetical protein
MGTIYEQWHCDFVMNICDPYIQWFGSNIATVGRYPAAKSVLNIYREFTLSECMYKLSHSPSMHAMPILTSV